MTSEERPDSGGSDLRGARWEPEAVDTSPFRRPFPWVVLGLIVAGIVGAFAYGEHSRAVEIRALRSELVATHMRRIGRPSESVRRFRTSIEAMIRRGAAMHHPDVLEPGFRIDSLRGRPGVYVRLRERDTASVASIEDALQIMEPDVIPHCLGITPVAMRTLYTKFAPITGEWLRSAEHTADTIRLRVRIDEVNRFADRDLPLLQSIAASEYLVLAIIRGESRARDEVDLFVFDARTGAIRLATNTKANGYLLTTRIEGFHAPSPSREALARSGATDCSIAAQARTRTGEFGAVEGEGPLDAGVVAPDGGVESHPDAGSAPSR